MEKAKRMAARERELGALDVAPQALAVIFGGATQERVAPISPGVDGGRDVGWPFVATLYLEAENACFEQLGQRWTDGFDILVHAIAYAPREAIAGQFLDGLTRENFSIAHDISAYSLAAMAKAARPMMANRNGAIITLSYLGAERALVNYNVMGVAKASLEATVRYLALNLGPEGTRVNAISAGPIKTLAAAGIANFRKMLGHVESYAPMRRSVTIDDVGNVAAFLCSDLAAGVTGEVTYVDAGYNILGMTGIE